MEEDDDDDDEGKYHKKLLKNFFNFRRAAREPANNVCRPLP
jgi:hypothetical protein